MNNPLSYLSLKLELFSRDGVRLKPASGFVVEAGDADYLITNWHVLSGRDIPSHEQQEPTVEPYTLKTSLYIHGEKEKGEWSVPPRRGTWKRITVQLYDNNDAPRWIERQANEPYQPMADVVALPLQVILNTDLFFRTVSYEKDGRSTKFSTIPLSAIDTDVKYGPPDVVHVIGYPLGWAPAGMDKTSTAFWRTSSIASEINEIGRIQSGTFFIDPCALEGMTGSPVIGLKNDRMKLLGIYSDSSTAELGANAGLVWDALLLKELIGAS